MAYRDSSTTRTTSGGTSLATVLFLIFLVLKLTDNIAWSWWWVTSPLWISAGLVVALIAVFAVAAGIASIFDTVRRDRRLARQADALRRRN